MCVELQVPSMDYSIYRYKNEMLPFCKYIKKYGHNIYKYKYPSENFSQDMISLLFNDVVERILLIAVG